MVVFNDAWIDVREVGVDASDEFNGIKNNFTAKQLGIKVSRYEDTKSFKVWPKVR